MSDDNLNTHCPVEMWKIFTETPLVIEVRCLWPKGVHPVKPAVSRCFDSSLYSNDTEFRIAVEEYVTQQNSSGYNMYATLNPLKSGMGVASAAKDSDVFIRRRLLIDIDRDYGKEHPALDSEIQDAKDLGDQIVEYLSQQGWIKPIRVMSGNGVHLVYQLDDLPNTEEITYAIRKLLNNLKRMFSAKNISIDVAVANSSRMAKIPGTLVRRGTETENRQYRVARIYE